RCALGCGSEQWKSDGHAQRQIECPAELNGLPFFLAFRNHAESFRLLITLGLETDIERVRSAAADAPPQTVTRQSVVGGAACDGEFERVVLQHANWSRTAPPARNDLDQP